MSHAVAVRHNFETGHRLPHLASPCVNLHGHSWWTTITITAPALHAGVVTEFGAYKHGLRDWIDTHLDHGLMLGTSDPLTGVLAQHGKVFRFGAHQPVGGEAHASDLAYPTVENVAVLLSRVASGLLMRLESAPGAQVTRVVVSETHVNQAEWTRA